MTRKNSHGLDAITADNVRPITARRFISARTLSGLDQQQAAAKLGYKNSSQLSKIESGQSGAALYLVQRASIVYGVSMDYLTGLSDYPESDAATAERLAIMRSVRYQLQEKTEELLKGIQTASADSAALMAHIGRLRNVIGDMWRQMCMHEGRYDASLDASPELADLPADVKSGLSRALRKMFAESMGSLKASMEIGIEHAEEANRYLKRRQSLKAHEYMDDVEKTHPLLAAIEDGKAGVISMFTVAKQMELLS